MVRSCYHRRNVLGTGSLVLGIKEVVNDAPGDDTLPVLLQEHIPRGVDSEQAVDHSTYLKSKYHIMQPFVSTFSLL